MPQLDVTFKELRQKLKDRSSLGTVGDDPVFSLIFDPAQMLEVKRCLDHWRAALMLDGWHVDVLSLADVVNSTLQNHPLRELLLDGERDDPFDFDEINKSLTEVLTSSRAIERRLLERIEAHSNDPKALLLVTDLEAIHPYLRIGAVEQRLQGQFAVPTVFLYPGIRTGQHNLKFLGIYPEDGNYRSTHVG